MVIRNGIATVFAWVLTAAATAAPRPAIVELYTSEGCSSCPPAEKLLEDLARRPNVLPLAFHVDYWDGLGWRDRFSMKEATQRQQAFADALNLSTVGTPQLVVEGKTAVWGVNASALERAVATPRTDIPLHVERNGTSLQIQAPAEGADAYDVYVVAYLPKAVTAIRAGENSGRTLTEVNVVRYIRKIGQSKDTARNWTFSLDTLPSDATQVVVLLQTPSSGSILGARSIGVRG